MLDSDPDFWAAVISIFGLPLLLAGLLLVIIGFFFARIFRKTDETKQLSSRPLGIYLAAALYFVSATLLMVSLITGFTKIDYGFFSPFTLLFMTILHTPLIILHLWLVRAIINRSKLARHVVTILGIVVIPVIIYFLFLYSNPSGYDSRYPISPNPPGTLDVFKDMLLPFYFVLYVLVSVYFYFSKKIEIYFNPIYPSNSNKSI